MANYYCKNCGHKSGSVSTLTAGSCGRHPNGTNKGKHELYEGSEKSQYVCKYCGHKSGSISTLTAGSCSKHPSGTNKGKHSPASFNIKELVDSLQSTLNDTPTDFNPLDFFQPHLELPNTQILAFLFNPWESHNQKDLFLKAFLEDVGIWDSNMPLMNTSVKAEDAFEYGRMDIRLTLKGHFDLAIENKINNAVDQDSQVERYYEELDKKCRYVYYLTLDGSKEPTNVKQLSCGSTDTDSEIQLISYKKNIITVLERSLPRVTNENVAQGIKVFMSALEAVAGNRMSSADNRSELTAQIIDFFEKKSCASLPETLEGASSTVAAIEECYTNARSIFPLLKELQTLKRKLEDKLPARKGEVCYIYTTNDTSNLEATANEKDFKRVICRWSTDMHIGVGLEIQSNIYLAYMLSYDAHKNSYSETPAWVGFIDNISKYDAQLDFQRYSEELGGDPCEENWGISLTHSSKAFDKFISRAGKITKDRLKELVQSAYAEVAGIMFDIKKQAKTELDAHPSDYVSMCLSSNDWYMTCQPKDFSLVVDGDPAVFWIHIANFTTRPIEIQKALTDKGFECEEGDYAYKYLFDNRKSSQYKKGSKEKFIKEALKELHWLDGLIPLQA